MSITLVSCYYKIKLINLHDKYDNYINNLFNNINKNVNFIIFTNKELEDYLAEKTKEFTNIKIIIKEFEDIDLLCKYRNIWENQYSLDLQKNTAKGIKSYILCNSKLNFIKEAIKFNYFNSDKFIWVDIGIIKNIDYLINLQNFPKYENISEDKIDIILLKNFNNPNQKFFQDEIHFSSLLFGSKINALIKFIKLYYDKFDEYLIHNKFIGCDKQIIASVYLENIILFNPIIPKSDEDRLFYLLKHYSITNIINKPLISCILSGRLGNYLFIIISSWAYAKKNNLDFVMDNIFEKNKYYNLFFSKIKTTNIENINFDIKKNFDIFDNILNYVHDNKSNILLNGYMQNANNFNIFRKEILENFFNIKSPLESNNNFFIHIRLKDFLISKLHNINLDNYYKKAIEYAKNIINFDKINIYIISDCIKEAKTKTYLNLLPLNNLIYINNKCYDEIQTFEIFKNCYIGCICGHSTFSWWGAYIINNPNKLVIIPNKFLNTNDDFSGMYLDYKIIDI